MLQRHDVDRHAEGGDTVTTIPADIAKARGAALRAVNELSVIAKTAGDDRTMYAANRAWTELFNLERGDKENRR